MSLGDETVRGYARVNETVIDTETSVRVLPTRIPFRSFRYPHVNVFHDATFIADDNRYYVDYKGKKNLVGTQPGIYRCMGSDGDVVPLAVKGATAPSSQGAIFRSFSGLQTHEEGFCFLADMDGVGEPTASALYVSFRDEPLRCIAQSWHSLDGWPDIRFVPEYGTMFLDCVLYTGYHVDQEGGSAAYWLLYDRSTGRSRVLLKSGQVLPDSRGGLSPIRAFARTQWIYYPWATVVSVSEVNLAMSVHLMDLSATNEPIEQRVTLIADAMMNAPEVPGSVFTAFYSAPVDRGRVAFAAEYVTRGGATTNQGVYFWEQRELEKIADSTDLVPGYSFRFASFDPWVSLDKGKILFRGRGPEGYEGLFLYDPDMEALFLLLDNNQSLIGKRISSFEIGSNCVVGDRMIFLARFEDESMGVYMALTPAYKTPRLDIPLPGDGVW